jgi:hypothetical protein
VCAACAAYCADPESDAPIGVSCIERGDGGGSPHSVEYELSWNDDGITALHDDGAWTTESDRGYVVRVDSGSLVTYSAQLVECDDDELEVCESAALGVVDSAAQAWPWRHAVFGPPLAWAGHGDDEIDPSAVTQPRVESLTGHTPLAFGAALASPAVYCRSHLLAGPLTADIEDAPDDDSLIGKTLWLTGSYLAPGSDEAVSLDVSTSSAYGAFAILRSKDGLPAPLASGHASARVQIARPRGRMFDGIDLASEAPDAIAKAVLRNLLRASETQIDIDAD